MAATQSLHISHDALAFSDGAEHHMFAIQAGGPGKCYEKLRAVGARSDIGHR